MTTTEPTPTDAMTPGDPGRPLGPVAEQERIHSLDVLRGVAILGIFCVNIQFFSLPMMDAVGHFTMESADTRERLAWSFIKVFCEFKFISMFSLLFGVGMVIQMMRAEAAGRGFAAVYLRRIGILALFGMCHAFLLWYGDILLVYAVLGTLLLAVRRLAPRTLLIAALTCVAIGSLLGGTCASMQLLFGQLQPPAAEVAMDEPGGATEAGDDATDEPGDSGQAPDPATGELAADDAGAAEEPVATGPLRGFEAMNKAQFDPSREVWIDAETAAYRDGPFGDAALFRAVSYGFAAISAIFGYGWRVVGMFMLGAALMKFDFFRPHRLDWQRRLAVWGLAVGIPLELAAVALQWSAGFELGVAWLVSTLMHDVGSFAMCVGYVGAITAAVSAGAAGWLSRGFSRVGRLALSTYLLETIIATAVMYWWGLGKFGTVARPWQLGFVVVVYAGLMVFSTVWLRCFRIGPFEWLWRSLTYLRPQPLLRR
jgi:uncharacterized protein